MKSGVTGGSGFIGSHVVDKLRDADHEVKVFDIKKPHRDDVEYCECDILDLDKILKETKDLDYIFHLAAVSNVNHAFEDPIKAVRLNAEGTANYLEACRKNDIKRFLFASTVWVYAGAVTSEVTEDSPFYMPGAGHIYTSTKIGAEMFCNDYHQLYEVDYTILRYGIPYGPRARAGTIVPIFIERALNGKPLSIFGDGSQYRNFIYVEDLADGNIAALQDAGKNQIYNLEGSRAISVKEVAETVQKLMGEGVKIEYKEARPGDYEGKHVSGNKAKRELDWEPKVDFEEGMKRYIDWYREQE
ncbi:MAG: NAD-dependent epimerase/dehydratase family protein [Planctomycetota bacterium]|jgi:UDP-glucose 4-epimerase